MVVSRREGQARIAWHGSCDSNGRDALLRVQQDLRQLLVPQHLLQDHSRVERDVLVVVPGRAERLASGSAWPARGQDGRDRADAPLQRRKHDLRLLRDVLDRRAARADLAPEQMVEDLRHVLLRLSMPTEEEREKVSQAAGATGEVAAEGLRLDWPGSSRDAPQTQRPLSARRAAA